MLLRYIFGPSVVKYNILSNNRRRKIGIFVKCLNRFCPRLKLHKVIDFFFFIITSHLSCTSYRHPKVKVEAKTFGQTTHRWSIRTKLTKCVFEGGARAELWRRVCLSSLIACLGLRSVVKCWSVVILCSLQNSQILHNSLNAWIKIESARFQSRNRACSAIKIGGGGSWYKHRETPFCEFAFSKIVSITWFYIVI